MQVIAFFCPKKLRSTRHKMPTAVTIWRTRSWESGHGLRCAGFVWTDAQHDRPTKLDLSYSVLENGRPGVEFFHSRGRPFPAVAWEFQGMSFARFSGV